MDDKTDKTTWVVTETLPHAGDIDSTLPMNFDNGLPASVGLLLMKESTPVVDGEKNNDLGIPEVPSEHDGQKIPPTMVPEESEREPVPQLKKSLVSFKVHALS